MLKQPVTSTSRWITGSVVVIALATLTGFAAWAAQPSSPHMTTAQPATPVAPLASESVTNALPVASPAPVAPSRGVAADAESRLMNPPRYPPTAVAQSLSGKVILLVDVGTDGKPTAIEVERAEPAGVFDEATVAAAWNWQFQPQVEKGVAVASRVRVPVDFRAPAPKEKFDLCVGNAASPDVNCGKRQP